MYYYRAGKQQESVAALEDSLETSILRLVSTFGRDLVPVVRGSKYKAQYSSKPELVVLLEKLYKQWPWVLFTSRC